MTLVYLPVCLPVSRALSPPFFSLSVFVCLFSHCLCLCLSDSLSLSLSRSAPTLTLPRPTHTYTHLPIREHIYRYSIVLLTVCPAISDKSFNIFIDCVRLPKSRGSKKNQARESNGATAVRVTLHLLFGTTIYYCHIVTDTNNNSDKLNK